MDENHIAITINTKHGNIVEEMARFVMNNLIPLDLHVVRFQDSGGCVGVAI
jgi:hypothetical protein